MKIVRGEVFSGPNVHAPVPVVRITLDLGSDAGHIASGLSECFQRNMLDLLPRRSAAGGRPGLANSDAAGAGFAQLVAEIALELQRNLGAEVDYLKVDTPPASQQCCVLYEFWDAGVALPAAALAVDALLRMIDATQQLATSGGSAWDGAREREQMLKELRPESLDLITMALVREAARRNIPWYRLVARKPFVQLGQGHRQKHIRESATSHTSSTARYLSKDKNATSLLLGRVGIPVPRQRLVTSVEQALGAAAEIGYPVVTKPLDRGNGKGVSVGLANADAVRWGFREAARYNEDIVVEQFVAGDDHRILVIDGKMVAAAKRIPGHVVGDGERDIGELVDAANADPRRGNEYEKLMVRLEFDAQAEQVLSEAGLTRASIPGRGQIVPLRRTANVSTGGTCVDVTEIVHPDNRDAAIRASRVLGLNVAGVDFLSTDIARSYREIGGGICEVNFSPGLRPHWNANPGRDVVGPIVDTMFAPGTQSRIPMVAVIGVAGASDVCRLVGRLLGSNGRTVGVATRDGVEIGDTLAVATDAANALGARTLLFDPSVEAAVLEGAADEVLRHGLAFARCDVAAVLSLAAPAGQSPTYSSADFVAASRVVVQAATQAVILNADDDACQSLLDPSDGRRLCLVSRQPESRLVASHVAAGGLVVVRAGKGELAQLRVHDNGKCPLELAWAAIRPFRAIDDTDPYRVLFALAIAYVFGVDAGRIREILASDG